MSDIPGFYDGGDDDDEYGPIDEQEEMTFDRINAFLKELKELSLRHRIEVAGQGMSPFLVHLDATNGYYYCDEDGEGIGFIYGTAIQ